MGLLDGKVALITGSARGQGRAHATRLAAEGADIIAVDLCAPLPEVPWPLATPDDLQETARLVESRGRRCLTCRADVRSASEIEAAVAGGLATFGHIDVVVANAGVGSYGSAWQLSEAEWDTVVDTNLKGAWLTCRAVIPSMIERGAGGSLILISSTAGLRPYANMAHYVAAKHGVVGLMRALALELGPHRIRVNAVHPTSVDTGMIQNEATYELFGGGRRGLTRAEVAPIFQRLNLLPVPWLEPGDISAAVLWLASDASRFVTGVALPVDAGASIR
ncbi:MAG: mycofactocin-coupled SDR family oxidoreductase [Sphaerobacter sp.]|nr:mycofactocin-coupled SDR family oxidoreductase [Sphaerobacter sp.]